MRRQRGLFFFFFLCFRGKKAAKLLKGEVCLSVQKKTDHCLQRIFLAAKRKEMKTNNAPKTVFLGSEGWGLRRRLSLHTLFMRYFMNAVPGGGGSASWACAQRHGWRQWLGPRFILLRAVPWQRRANQAKEKLNTFPEVLWLLQMWNWDPNPTCLASKLLGRTYQQRV